MTNITLKVENNEVKASNGAVISINNAETIFELVKQVKESGKEWTPQTWYQGYIKKYYKHLGRYKKYYVEKVFPNGDMKIKCCAAEFQEHKRPARLESETKKRTTIIKWEEIQKAGEQVSRKILEQWR